MTALDQYDRLEATGIWRRSQSDEAREVLVTFGNATLTLSALDQEGDTPIAHWSLGAVRRRESSPNRAVFSPDAEASETLTVEDELLMQALDKVLRDRVKGTERKTPRSRFWLAAVVLVLLSGAYVALPKLAVSLATRLISPERAELLAQDMIKLIEGRSGPECTNGSAQNALSMIAQRLHPNGIFNIHVLDLGDNLTVALPGHVLLDRSLVERAQSAEEIAGWVSLTIVETSKATATRHLFEGANSRDVLGFLSDGTVATQSKNRAVNQLLLASSPPQTAAISNAVTLMENAQISPQNWLSALEREGIDAGQPKDTRISAEPLLSDQNWVALQNICDG